MNIKRQDGWLSTPHKKTVETNSIKLKIVAFTPVRRGFSNIKKGFWYIVVASDYLEKLNHKSV